MVGCGVVMNMFEIFVGWVVGVVGLVDIVMECRFKFEKNYINVKIVK